MSRVGSLKLSRERFHQSSHRHGSDAIKKAPADMRGFVNRGLIGSVRGSGICGIPFQFGGAV